MIAATDMHIGQCASVVAVKIWDYYSQIRSDLAINLTQILQTLALDVTAWERVDLPS